jgi:hypothetical protein
LKVKASKTDGKDGKDGKIKDGKDGHRWGHPSTKDGTKMGTSINWKETEGGGIHQLLGKDGGVDQLSRRKND